MSTFTKEPPADGDTSSVSAASKTHSKYGVSEGPRQLSLKKAIETDDNVTQQEHSVSNKKKQFAEACLDEFRDSLLDGGPYKTHPYWLTFADPAVEEGYCHFMYANSGFYGGKLWHAVVLVAFLIMLAYHPNGAKLFSHWAWIALETSFFLTIFLMAALFVDRVNPYREAVFLTALFIHWPSLLIVTMRGKDPDTFSYAIPLICYFFCTFTTFARFKFLAAFLLSVPTITFLATSFGRQDYWDRHNHLEMVLWLMGVPCCFCLRIFEYRCRVCYAEVCMANDQLDATDEKSEVTQRIVANFFPPTAAADLLTGTELLSSNTYPDAVLIQSDLQGFTAHCSKTEPAEVVAMLSKMFELIDTLGPRYGTEKMASVGDAYLGVCFPTHPLCIGIDGSGAVSLSVRCSSTIAFATEFMNTVPELKMRVGVCHGTVTVGIVGDHPPKMDAFGDAVKRVGELERLGKPSHVHVGEVTMELALTTGSTTGEGPKSFHGVLVPGWIDDKPPVFLDLNDTLRDHIDAHASQIMTHLSRYGDSLKDVIRRRHSFSSQQSGQTLQNYGSTTHDAAIVAIDEGTPLGDTRRRSVQYHSVEKETLQSTVSLGMSQQDDDDGVTVYSHGDLVRVSTNDKGFHMLHPLLLTFKEAVVEERFQSYLLNAKLVFTAQQILLALETIIVVAALGCVCIDTTNNHTVFVLMIAALASWCGYLRLIGCDHKFNIAFVWVFYFGMCLMSSLLSSDCSSSQEDMNGYYVGVIWSLLSISFAFAPSFCLEAPIWARVVIIVISCSVTLVFPAIHEGAVGRTDVRLDWYLLVLFLASIGVTYFVEYNVRSTFAAGIRVRRNVTLAKKRHARNAKKCIDTMLPRFVSDEIMKPPTESNDPSAAQSNEEGAQSAPEGMLWEYPRAVVMFLNFNTTDGTEMSVEGIDTIVKAVEKIAACESGVQKVKSIQNTILFVSGIKKHSNPQGCAVKMLSVALEVIDNLSGSHIEVRCGLNTGPCFGAVIGTTGLSFDIFGDTVNTASRMQSHAGSNAVHFPKTFVELLGEYAESRFKVSSCGAINIKGKGFMEIFKGAPYVPEMEVTSPATEAQQVDTAPSSAMDYGMDDGCYPGYVDDDAFMI